MVNPQLKFERNVRINLIKKMIKKAGKNLVRRNLVMEICILYGVQQRKASEYIKVAQYMLDNE